jgi:hypothetical protein
VLADRLGEAISADVALLRVEISPIKQVLRIGFEARDEPQMLAFVARLDDSFETQLHHSARAAGEGVVQASLSATARATTQGARE